MARRRSKRSTGTPSKKASTRAASAAANKATQPRHNGTTPPTETGDGLRPTAISPSTSGNDAPSEPRDTASSQPLQNDMLLGGDYRILETAARDETSVSYKAEDLNLGVSVLIKEFFPLARAVRRPDGTAIAADGESTATPTRLDLAEFLKEARTLVRFHHPNIVRVHRVFEENGTAYMVLDDEQGQTLEKYLTGLKRRPTQIELDRIVGPLISALTAVHACKFLHRSISPENILIRTDGSPAMLNFGAARQVIDAPDGVLSTVMHSPYTAPEDFAQGDAMQGPWTDIYALAAVVYRAITEKEPLGSSARLVKDVLVPSSELGASEYRPEFLEAIDSALSIRPEDRPQSVDSWTGIAAGDDATVVRAPSKAVQAPTRVGAVDQAAPIDSSPRSVDTEKRNTVAGKTTRSFSETPKLTFASVATRLVESIPDINEESGGSRLPYERWFIPAAIICGVLGAIFFSAGINFALAAVTQVAATVLFFLRGLFPLRRFMNNITRSADESVRRGEQVTRTAAFMIVAILVLMMVNPLFLTSHVAINSELPIVYLALVIGFPAILMGAFAALGTPIRKPILSFAFGLVNVFVFLFCVFLLFQFATTNPQSPVHPAILVNRYLYIVATICCCTLCAYIFMGRMSAKQRLKHAASAN